jgi:hypothetical protein
MGRVEDVLGKGWETHVDGDSFRIKLNTPELFEDWSRKVNQKTEIQKSIDYLNLKGFSNLPQWVIKLDEEVEEKKFAQLLDHCHQGVGRGVDWQEK